MAVSLDQGPLPLPQQPLSRGSGNFFLPSSSPGLFGSQENQSSLASGYLMTPGSFPILCKSL